MRFLSISVEHFRCVRKARVEFARGLNILFGPNDLGKSSVAHAIRAALLLQHGAKEHEKFVAWDGSGEPYVELVFESEPQRIWRVRKKFGAAGSSFLDESRNAFDFTNECRGRDVDGRLREILRWGIAPPGKGASKGMPASFLSRALFAEQDQVDAIFEHALAGDSDETGKRQLSEVLQAMAEDPLFRNVLARAQERVDEAFNKAGGRKFGKNSPWTKHREAISQADKRYTQCQGELKATEALELELQQLVEQKLQCQENVASGEALLHKVEGDLQRQQQRQQIADRLEESKTRLLSIEKELDALAAAEKHQLNLAERVVSLQHAEEASKAAERGAAAEVRAAGEALGQLQSEDRVRERLLKQSTVKEQQAELRAEQERIRTTLSQIGAIETAEARVRSLESEAQLLSQSVTALEAQYDDAVQAVSDSQEQQRQLDAIARLYRVKRTRVDVDQAEQAVTQINKWREETREKREEAAALESALPAFSLPDSGKLNDLRRLESDIRVATGKLDVGLAIAVHPKRNIRLTVQRDGEQQEDHELANSPFDIRARSQITLNIEGVAEINVAGGADDAREQLASLESRWNTEARPFFEAAGVATSEELAEIVDDTNRKKRDLEDAQNAARQLEQRTADQPDWDRTLSERRALYEGLEKQLGDADRGKLEKAAQKLGLRDVTAVERRVATLRTDHNRLISTQNELATLLAREQGRATEKQQSLESARQGLFQVESGFEGNWREKKQELGSRQEQIASEISNLQHEIDNLTAAEDQSVADAQTTLYKRRAELSAAEAARQTATKNLTDVREEKATHEGALKVMRGAAAKLDEKAARDTVEQIEEELRSYPAPDSPVAEQQVAEARNKVEATRDELEKIENHIHAKRGALEQVGGDVSKQRAAEAAAQLETAKQRERESELDFNAWELLRQTLREAEREESSHLGRLLAGPIASRFSKLTSGRYSKLALGPSLETQGIFVAGDERDISLLSVGTKDQLSTVLRLTVAEQLESAIVLDDQLTQSDASKMEWLRDFLLQIATKIQVIVFTCRPEYYVPNGAVHPAVQSLDLLRMIERSPRTLPK